MKEIIVAKNAGFCWGVQRAFDRIMKIAAEVPEGHPVFTYGPLIHNPQAVLMLESKGIHVLNSTSEHIDGTIVIRTHGVPPDVREGLKKSGAKICNATCPDVARIQALVRKHKRLGFGIIIIGDKTHPEVEALLGFAGDSGRCLISPEEVEKLPEWKNV